MGVGAIVALSAWTRRQGGMVTSAQAEAAGVTRYALHSLVRAGALDRVRHGVYKLVGAPWSRNDEIRAVWLQSEPGPLGPEQRRAAVSRQTAALVYGFGVLMPPSIQVTLPGPRRTTMPGVRWFVGQLDDSELAWVDDILVTRPARIVADLLDDGYADLEHVGSIAADAIYDHELTVHELARVCVPHAVRFGLPAGDGAAMAGLMLDLDEFDEDDAAAAA